VLSGGAARHGPPRPSSPLYRLDMVRKSVRLPSDTVGLPLSTVGGPPEPTRLMEIAYAAGIWPTELREWLRAEIPRRRLAESGLSRTADGPAAPPAPLQGEMQASRFGQKNRTAAQTPPDPPETARNSRGRDRGQARVRMAQPCGLERRGSREAAPPEAQGLKDCVT
jgi:hypothetical protein